MLNNSTGGLTQTQAQEVIERLRQGIPSDIISYSAGYDDLLREVREHHLQSAIPGRIRFICGRIGSGKTHLLHLLRDQAISANHVASYVPLNARETPFHQFDLVFRAIITNIRVPHVSDVEETAVPACHHPFEQLLRRAVGVDSADSVTNINEATDNLFNNTNIDVCFRNAVISYWQTFLDNQDEQIQSRMKRDRLLQWFFADQVRPPDVTTTIDSNNARQMLQSLSAFILHMEYAGHVILFDEAESSFLTMNRTQRGQAYNNLRCLIDSINEIPGLFMVYTTTPDFYYDENHGVSTNEALRSRIGEPTERPPRQFDPTDHAPEQPDNLTYYRQLTISHLTEYDFRVTGMYRLSGFADGWAMTGEKVRTGCGAGLSRREFIGRCLYAGGSLLAFTACGHGAADAAAPARASISRGTRGRGFVTEWLTTTADETITLPLSNNGTFDCTVDWGDGSTSTITAFDSVDRIHEYAIAGAYKVEITGECPGWRFLTAATSRDKIINIINWGHPDKFGGFGILHGAFYSCTNLVSLGKNKIIVKSGVTSARNIFQACSKIEAIPSGIFDNLTDVGNGAYLSAFLSCSALTEIPAGLFDYGINAAERAFDGTFAYCVSLKTIPNGLFKFNTKVSGQGFSTTFMNCDNLTTIGSDLFGGCADNSDIIFNRTFQNCINLEVIPPGLFDNCAGARDRAFELTFYNCGEIKTIPSDLFKYNVNVRHMAFYITFGVCQGITEIPAGLFVHNVNVEEGGFWATFGWCANLETVPADLFKYNTKLAKRGFSELFLNCTSLETIPAGLFDYNVNLEEHGFAGLFKGCTSLKSIPANLFDNNIKVSSSGFREAFMNCNSLETIPANIFANAVDLCGEGFVDTFKNCYKLQHNANIITDIYLNKGIDFTRCFSLDAAFTGTQGTAPALWDYTYGDEFEVLVIDRPPATDWEVDDIITGQTDGATCKIVAKLTDKLYKVSDYTGTFKRSISDPPEPSRRSGETIGVTGNASKLIKQGLSYPYATNNPNTKTDCFDGHSASSLSNYADVPEAWK